MAASGYKDSPWEALGVEQGHHGHWDCDQEGTKKRLCGHRDFGSFEPTVYD